MYYLGAHHKHTQFQILWGFRHIDVHDHLISLANHQKLLLLRQRDVGMWKGAGRTGL